MATAKTKKATEKETVSKVAEPVAAPQEEIVVEAIKEEPKKEEPIVVVVKKESPNQVLDTESDEIRFLRTVLRVQNEGGFGTHLNGLVNERIEKLKTKK